jgi:uncharacterized damage-inducible protein DinB
MFTQHTCVTIIALSVFSSALIADDVPAFRRDLLDPLHHAEQELLALAKATPPEKYSWRPGKGVRSAGEVYQHIANGNNLILTFVAEKPLDRKALNQMIQDNAKLEQAVTDKDQIIANMKESFERARAVIMKMSQADMDRPVKFFGTDGTIRGVLISITNHAHEHLGQSIAYARMMGIVPPWSKG